MSGFNMDEIFLLQWKTMTKEQQAIYYEEADRQRQLHKQLYPEWSNRQNYVSTPSSSDNVPNKALLGTVSLCSCFVGNKKENSETKKANLQHVDWSYWRWLEISLDFNSLRLVVGTFLYGGNNLEILLLTWMELGFRQGRLFSRQGKYKDIHRAAKTLWAPT